MASKRVIGRNMAWNAVGLVVETGTGFLVMPFLILKLGEATYGVWIVLGALTSYFGLLDFGIRGSIGRHVALYHASGNRAGVNQTLTGGLAILSLVGLAAAAGLLACEPLFFRLFDVPKERHADAALALRVVTAQFALALLFTAFDATLWGYQRFDWLNVVDVPAALLRAGLTFALVGSADDLIVLAYIVLGVTLATGAAKAALCCRADPRLRVGVHYLTRPSLRELIEFGRWNLLANVARVTRRQFSPLLIGSLLGLSVVASFSIADRLLVAVAAALSAITGVLTPFATALHATEQTGKQRNMFLIGGQHTSAFAAFLIAFLVVLGRPLIGLWIGTKFADTALLLGILAAGELLPNTQYVTNGILQASARHRALAVFSLLETIAVGLLAVVLIPSLGLVGAGLAIAVPGLLARGVAPLIQGCGVVGLPVRQYLVQAIALPLLCAAVPAGIVGVAEDLHPPGNWPEFIGFGAGYTALFTVCYGCLLWWTEVRRLPARLLRIGSAQARDAGAPVPSPDKAPARAGAGLPLGGGVPAVTGRE